MDPASCFENLKSRRNRSNNSTEETKGPKPVSSASDSERAMSLISCPECGRQISTQAESCPQCGHPNRAAAPAATGPECYSCSALATTRCQSCGALSCAQHLQSIYVTHGRGGAYELRCASCYSTAQAFRIFGWVVTGIAVVVVLVFALTMLGR